MSHVATTVRQAPLTGIRGWLALLGIGMIINPIRAIYQLGKYYSDETTLTVFQSLPAAMIGELILNLAWLAFLFYVSATFFKEKRIFKKVFTIAALVGPVTIFFDLLWVSAISGVPLASLIPAMTEQIGQTIGYMIVGLPWVAYVWRSRRVANTFVN